MQQERKYLSKTEEMIMKVIWRYAGDISTPDLIEIFNNEYGKDYARTTMVTFLERLQNKGYVQTYRKGRKSFVHELVLESKYVNEILRNFIDFWFDGNEERMIETIKEK